MSDLHWMAVYCKSRNEKKVVQRLTAKGYEAYCPMQTRKKQWSDRIKTVTEPIISSYVFVRCTEIQRIEVLQDPSILNFVFYIGKPAVIRDVEMDKLKYIMGEQNQTLGDIVLDNFERGDKVKLLKDGFTDLEGVLQKVEKHKVSVLIESIGLVISLAKTHIEKQ
mgnify:FL=1